MDTNALLQVLASVLFTVGVLALAASYTSFDPLGLAAADAFSTGVILTSGGFVLLADLRRRADGHTRSA